MQQVDSMRDAALIILGEHPQLTPGAIAAIINSDQRFLPIRQKWNGRVARDQVYAAMSGLRSKAHVEKNFIMPVGGNVGATKPYTLTGYGEKLLRDRFGVTVPAPPPAVERVNHPPHYGGEDNTYEAIKVIEAWELDFCLGNTVKYISRAGKKDKAKEVEDLQKARWYLDRRIGQLGGE